MKYITLAVIVALTGCDSPQPEQQPTETTEYNALSGNDTTPALPLVKTLKASAQVACVACSHDGRLIATGLLFDGIVIWNAESGELRKKLASGLTVKSVAFSPDDKQIAATGSFGGSSDVAVWDIQSGETVAEFELQSGSGTRVSFSPDGQRLAAADDSYTKVWNLENGAEEFMIEGISPVFSDNETLMTTGRKSGAKDNKYGVKAWNQSGKEQATMHGLAKLARFVAVNKDGLRIAAGSTNGEIKVWSADSGEQLMATGYSEPSMISSLNFSPDGRWLVTVSGKTFTMWDAETGEEFTTIEGKPSGFLLSDAGFTPDGKTLVVASTANVVLLWDASPLLAE